MTGPKIFIIGLNKCGTNSLHQLFRRSGIPSLHFRTPELGNAAIRLLNNIALGRPSLTGMEDFVAYSDFSFADNRLYIEGVRFFRQFHADYPDAFFILNTRDEDQWLASRFGHMRGKLAQRAKAAFDIDENGLRALWLQQFRTHHAEVRAYFENQPRFLEFDIERDDPKTLASFLAPVHRVDPKRWGHHNKSADKASA
ncbi:MAG: sulfotransferase [Pseudomonadota bacterium]